MYTRCPTCSTCFRVTDRHLAIAKGKVRCGQCQLVFNAPEHSIDDLPVNELSTQKSPSAAAPIPHKEKPEIKKPLIAETRQEKENKQTQSSPQDESVSTIKVEKKESKTTAPKEHVIKILESKEETYFDAGATTVSDISPLKSDEPDKTDFDKHSKENNNDDDIEFDENFNLDEAIDAFTQEANNDNDVKVDDNEEPSVTETELFIPKGNSSGDVFTTDAYDNTSAASVEDILDDMEGQLSLDIKEPDNHSNYDPNLEFDFLKISDDELESESKNNFAESEKQETTIEDEFNFIEEDEGNEFTISEKNNNSQNESSIEVDELFDQVDLSDFEDDEVSEEIVLEEQHENKLGMHNDEHIPMQLRDDIEQLQNTSQRRWHPLIGVSLIIVLLLVSFSQLAFFRAHELVKLIPSSRPILESFCDSIGCQYSGPRDTKQIQLLSRDVRLHPKEKKALLISAAMINNAYFAQPYPDIHVRLSDISGNVVAERIFNSKTYMGKISNPFLLMKSKTPVHINFEVVDPGKDAINFEFTFL